MWNTLQNLKSVERKDANHEIIWENYLKRFEINSSLRFSSLNWRVFAKVLNLGQYIAKSTDVLLMFLEFE